MLLEGIFAAVPTPFYADERVYFRKIEHNMARYSRSLLSGMVVLGSTGEAVELTDAESREVLRVAAQHTDVLAPLADAEDALQVWSAKPNASSSAAFIASIADLDGRDVD